MNRLEDRWALWIALLQTACQLVHALCVEFHFIDRANENVLDLLRLLFLADVYRSARAHVLDVGHRFLPAVRDEF